MVVLRAEDIVVIHASTSSATSVEEPPPVLKIVFPSDSSVRKWRKKQEPGVVTSADFRGRLEERREKNGRRNRSVQNNKTTGRHSERRMWTDGRRTQLFNHHQTWQKLPWCVQCLAQRRSMLWKVGWLCLKVWRMVSWNFHGKWSRCVLPCVRFACYYRIHANVR